MNFIDTLIYIVPAAIIAIGIHEASHGYASYLLGDPTPKNEDRLTLNPLKHFDLLGTICLILFKFGWAKPVRVNPRYYKNEKTGMAIVALAGPLSNFIISFFSILFALIIVKESKGSLSATQRYFYNFFYVLAVINVGLGVFNLIPIPPLDGSKILGAFLTKSQYYNYMKFERYGFIILVILLLFDVLSKPLYLFQSSIIDFLQTLARTVLKM